MRMCRRVLSGILFLVFTMQGLQAQSALMPYEQAFKPGYYAKASCMAYDTLSQWILAGNFKDTSAITTPAYIMKLDSTGHTLWDSLPVHRTFPFSDHCEINDLIHTADQNFVITGTVYNCSGLVAGSGYLQKFNRNGTILWSKNYPAPVNRFGLPFAHIAELKTGRLLVSRDTTAYCTQTTGDSIWAHNYTQSLIYCVGQNHASQLMLGCARAIILTDTLGTVQATLPYNKPVEAIFENADSTYIVLTNHSLFKLNKSFVAVQTFNLRTWFGAEARMKQVNGLFWITGRDTVSGGVRVVCVSPALAVIHTASWADNKVVAADIAIGPHELAVAGTENSGGNTNGFFKAMNTNAQYGKDTTDAGVIKIVLDSAKRVTQTSYPAGVTDVYFKTTVTVKNFGKDTLRSVYLNTFMGLDNPCNDQHWFVKDSCKVAPGDSLVIHPGWLVAKMQHTGTGAYSMPVCFWTSVPNSVVDKKHSNDELCTTIGIPLGIAENSLQHLVHVYPNPASVSFTLDLPEQGNESYRIALYTPAGQLIQHREVRNVPTLQWDISTLAPGMYFLYIQDAVTGTKAIQKLIKY